ncbi:DUF2147 domain-containing protein [uncultured Chryseobacterium sp.]|uniref:DUF2147 domain-containing protein n=1 Tax=uncultured Chryseobacterium sp. TaxID=259322 RepID=UPI0025FD2E59|nr:DUF2147 domain-containing protein [uncultured Chryseobacterium sp.]
MKKTFLILLLLTFSKMLYSQSNPDDITGTWYSAVKGGSVQIYKSGETYSGKLIDLKPSADKNGNPLSDIHNPDVAKRGRPLIGILLLTNITYDRKKKRWKGKLYDYDGAKGNTYDSYLTLTPEGRLNIKGFWGLSFFGLNPGLSLERIHAE